MLINNKENEILKHISVKTEDLHFVKDLDSLLDKVLCEVRNSTCADAGSVYLVEGGKLKFSYVQNDSLLKKDENNKFNYSDHELEINDRSIAGYVAFTGEPLAIENAYNIKGDMPYSFNTSFDKASNHKTSSILTIPLKTSRGKIVGVLQLINAMNEKNEIIPFTEQDKLYLTFFANNAASTIERAIMTREIILRMLRMSEMRDPTETDAHVNRVGAFSVEIYHKWALKVGISIEEIKKIRDTLRLSAMLHDVGKVAIPDTILKKPSKLTDEEYEIMKHHTTYSAHLFKNSSSEIDQMAAEIAIKHHERWDGKGYPGKIENLFAENIKMGEGKLREETPLYGRIVALSDVYDALSSKRVYKRCMAAG